MFIPKTHMFSLAKIIIELISTAFLNIYTIIVIYTVKKEIYFDPPLFSIGVYQLTPIFAGLNKIK